MSRGAANLQEKERERALQVQSGLPALCGSRKKKRGVTFEGVQDGGG